MIRIFYKIDNVFSPIKNACIKSKYKVRVDMSNANQSFLRTNEFLEDSSHQKD